MRSARRLGAPDPPAAALPAPRPRPRRHCRASGRRSRTRPAAACRAAPRDRSCRRPLTPARTRSRKSLTPARMRRAPPELALGLRVRRTTALGHHHYASLSGEQSQNETRHTPRLLAAKHLCQDRQPLGDRGGIIVDDVVDTATAVLDRCHRRLRGVGDVDKRPYAATVTDQRKPALADHLIDITAGRHVCAWPVEAAVTQDDTLSPPRLQDSLLEVSERGHACAQFARGSRVERVLLALHRSAGARV